MLRRLGETCDSINDESSAILLFQIRQPPFQRSRLFRQLINRLRQIVLKQRYLSELRLRSKDDFFWISFAGFAFMLVGWLGAAQGTSAIAQ